MLSTAGGLRITALITDESCRSLALCDGKLVNASVKAPWVMVQQDLPQAERAHGVCASAAENSFPALVERVREDDMVAEILAALPEGSQVCALQLTHPDGGLRLRAGDQVRILFKAFSVILSLD